MKFLTPTDRNGRAAFTLVELLVVLFLLMILAAIALPSVRKILSDQLVSRTSRNVTAYIDVARNRAISEGRQVGILIERSGVDARGAAHSIRIRQLTDVPPYSGDSSNSFAVIQTNGTTAFFDASDNQLLALSASMVRDPSLANDSDDPQAPIRNGDYIELPGGRLVPFTMRYRELNPSPAPNPPLPVVIDFDLREVQTDPTGQIQSNTFPSGFKPIPTARAFKFKIHRRPIVSTVAPLDLPKGVAIDFNYSGSGVSGNQFAPRAFGAFPGSIFAPNIAIVFGPDGKVVQVTELDTSPLSATPAQPPVARLGAPTGQIFLCLGDIDGVRPDNLFGQEKKATATLLNLNSNWIVINPSTGRTVAAPFGPVASIPSGVITDTTDASLSPAIIQARLLANFADTVDQE